jgi:hypothetical protein
MNSAKPFQQATIRVALDAFDARRRVRRFLVADEVGLGKTIVARGVIKGLMQRKAQNGGGPLRVFYVCNSLAIASQNRGSLLKVLTDKELRKQAACDVDRLTLAPNRELSPDLPLHLYTLTPGTSIPDRKGKQRSGAVLERALLHNLLKRRYPALAAPPEVGEWLQRNATSWWSLWKDKAEAQPTPMLEVTFYRILREQLKLGPGQHLPPVLHQRILDDPLETIKLLRVVLAKSGLAHLAPDLVIFDEFQRFTDLLACNRKDSKDGKSSEIAQMMVRSGPEGPAVLLLSATPYQLFGGDFDQAFSDVPHHQQFHDLVEWLLGKDEAASKARRELEEAFHRYGEALRSTNPTGAATQAAKTDIECRLRRIIARTERFSHDAGRDIADLLRVPAPLSAEDLYAFRHLSDCFRGSGDEAPQGAVSTAVPYWSSVPLAMQTLGPDYKAWKGAKRVPPPSPALTLTKKQRNDFAGPKTWPHARLRALQGELSAERLATPWVSPSLPWWDVGGAWASAPPEKVLLFSRFRAAPRAIASLLSFDVERYLLANKNLEYEQVTKRTILGPSRENFAFFHTSSALAQAVDPWRLRGIPRRRLLAQAEKEVGAWLKARGVSVRRSGEVVRNLPELLVRLERKTGTWDASLWAWQTLAVELARTNTTDGEMSLQARIKQWSAAVDGELSSVSPEELRLLTRAALANPGVIVARTLARHGLDLSTGQGVLNALRVAWEGLRSYLNNPWMDAALPGTGEPRERIWNAAIDGNLESVLDEHLWVTRTLRNLEPSDLPGHLTKALGLRTSDVKIHGLGSPDFTLRAHSALAFTHEVRTHRPDRVAEEPAVRTDDLRDAFNSPFWPHVLASTSVGQEGLDFHAWCAAIAHWDLPGDPVDLEQREGRVDRYAGLATRRALAMGIKFSSDAVAAGGSPWETLAQLADEEQQDDPTGLAPWWIYPGAKVRRIVFDVPLSEARARFEYLRQQRLLYRLALGQPDQEDLVRALHGRLSTEDVLAATIDLSPWKRKC